MLDVSKEFPASVSNNSSVTVKRAIKVILQSLTAYFYVVFVVARLGVGIIGERNYLWENSCVKLFL